MSKIEWTDKTWNPLIGCSKISEGCNNCYAEKLAHRLAHIKQTEHYSFCLENKKWNGHITKNELQKTFSKKPQKIFICSMGDLFHENVQDHWLESIFKETITYHDNDHHTFIILTKRPARMREWFKSFYNESGYSGEIPIPNLWIGVTCENQETANERIPILLNIPATKRFVSCEPLLTDINFPYYDGWISTYNNPDNSGCEQMAEPMLFDIDWVIIGGETGNKARQMKKEWVENIINQCESCNVPVFFKQWGEHNDKGEKVGKKKAGNKINGNTYLQFP